MGIERSYDADTAREYAGVIPRNLNMDWDAWLADHKNVMITDDKNVGLATYNYPGVYTVHWFFTVRGREALDLAIKMLDYFFKNYDVKTVMGITHEDIRGARWLARQVGLKSYGMIECLDGPNELFCMTKDEFYERQK